MNGETRTLLSGRFYLCRDSFNMWIEEKADGKAFRRVTGYYQSFPELARAFADIRFRTEEAAKSGELLKKMAAIQTEVYSIVERLRKMEA